MGFGIDMAKAREIHKTNIRSAREPLLAALDVDFQRALEVGTATTSIVAQKQALRDVTNNTTLDDATSESEVRAVWDTDVLGARPAEHT